MNQKQILDIKEIASFLGVSISEIRRLIKAGELPCFRIGNRIKFNMESVNEWIKQQEQLTKLEQPDYSFLFL